MTSYETSPCSAPLGDREAAIMNVVWQRDETTVEHVRAALDEVTQETHRTRSYE